MAAKVFVAVLASSARQFRSRLQTAKKITSDLHIDIMDGLFVPTKSISPSVLAQTRLPSTAEIHLMVRDPLAWLNAIKRSGARHAVLHWELGAAKLGPLVIMFERAGIRVSLAVNPSTGFRGLTRFAGRRSVVVMGVNPGTYHSRFIPKTVARVKAMHGMAPKNVIACDGGMHDTTILKVVKAGANHIVVGSAIMLAPNPAQVFRQLQRVVKRQKK